MQINLGTASLSPAAITAQSNAVSSSLASAVSSGALASSISEEATKRGEIVSVTTELEQSAVVELLDIVLAAEVDEVSNWAYLAVGIPNLCLVALIVTCWIALAWPRKADFWSSESKSEDAAQNSADLGKSVCTAYRDC